MNVKDTIFNLQALLGIPLAKRAPTIGPLTRAAFERLTVLPLSAEWPGEVIQGIQNEGQLRQINPAGQELVKHFEALYLTAYQDEASIWTIGWGHTGLQHNDGTVYKGRTISKEKAQELFLYDMMQFERRVSTLITVPLNDNQYSACVSFDFNTGGLTLSDGRPSTFRKLLNAENYAAAADELLKWNTVGGRVLRGLTRRRKSERNLFLGIFPAIVEG